MTRENTTDEPMMDEWADDKPAETSVIPVVDINTLEIPDEDKALAFSHHHRVKLVEHLTKKGAPGDTEEMNVLLKTLDGIDRQALSRKRIAADKDIAAGNTEADKNLLTELLKKIPNAPSHPIDMGEIVGEAAEIPTLSKDYQPGVVVEGQTDKTPASDTYQSFMVRQTGVAPAKS